MGLPHIELAETLELPDGRTAEFETRGAGEALLWVEGGPGFPAHLARPDVDLIADRFECHLVNAPGCGRTDPPTESSGYSLQGHVAFFDDVRAALSLGAVTVMGHSWGGLVAAAFAAMRPDSVSRLVIIDGYAGERSVPEDLAEAERERVFARFRSRSWFDTALSALERTFDSREMTEEEFVRTFNHCWPLYFADPESERSVGHIARLRRELRLNKEVSDLWDAGMFDDDVVPLLGRISSPTLIVAGELDFICGPAWNRPLADGIPGARYVEIPDVGHLPQYEDPERFRRELFSWADGR